VLYYACKVLLDYVNMILLSTHQHRTWYLYNIYSRIRFESYHRACDASEIEDFLQC